MTQLLLFALLLLQQPQVPTDSTGVVSGTILYSDGTPAAGTFLRLSLAGQPPRSGGISDATGAFTLRAAPGQYVLSASFGGITVYYPGVATQAEAKPVVVTAGAITGGMSFSLPASATGVRIRGRVSIPANYPTPATELRVETVRQGNRTPIASDGTFELTHILPGNYPLTVNAPAVQPVTVTVGDRDITDVALVVPPLVPVRGNVTVDGNGARPGISIRFGGLLPAGGMPTTQPYVLPVNIAADDAFSIALPVGQYQLLLNSLPEGYYLKGLSAGSTNLLTSPLTVSPTDAPIRVAITLGRSPKIRVTGRVTQPSQSASAPPDKIALAGVAFTESAEATLRPDGSFEFSKVTPGPYLARVGLTSSVSSTPTLITIPNRNVTDLEIPIPSPREISGRIAVDGNGPPPKFSLLLIRGSSLPVDESRRGQLASIPPSALVNLIQSGGSAGTHVLQINVNALPDGSFKMKVPDGEYRVVTVPTGLPSAGMPAAYFLRSLRANSSDLMAEPLRVSEKESTQIDAGFGTTAPNPWVKLSGRVAGLDTSRNTLRVALESDLTSTIETYIDAEGKFEFPAVLQRTNYTVRLVPSVPAASSPLVPVADKDVTDVQIVLPPEREMTVRVTGEGNNPVPAFGLTLSSQSNSMTVVVRPEADGTFKGKFPEDERRVSIIGLPLGYNISSATFGSTNILRQPLKIGGSAASEIQIRLTVDPAVAWGSVRGRVTGLDIEKGPVRLVLNSVDSFSAFEAAVNADGSFNFPRLPLGTYMPSLDGAIVAKRLSAAPIVVSGPDIAGIEITAPQQSGLTEHSATEETPTGAVALDFPGGGRVAANESAAVANLRTINTALVTYLSSSRGKYGNLQDLVQAGLLDRTFMETKSGFRFSIISIGSEYAAAAIPANSATGRFGYFSSPDAVVRYSTFEPLAPPQQSGRPVQ